MKDCDNNEFVIGDQLRLNVPHDYYHGMVVEVTAIDSHHFECIQLELFKRSPAGKQWHQQNPKYWQLIKESVMSFKVGDVVEVIKNGHGVSAAGFVVEIVSLESTGSYKCKVLTTPTGNMKGYILIFPPEYLAPLESKENKKLGEMVVVFKKDKIVRKDDFAQLMNMNGATFKESYMDGPHDKFVYEINSAAALNAAQNSSAIYSMTWFPGV
jgi:hypothetical protein